MSLLGAKTNRYKGVSFAPFVVEIEKVELLLECKAIRAFSMCYIYYEIVLSSSPAGFIWGTIARLLLLVLYHASLMHIKCVRGSPTGNTKGIQIYINGKVGQIT